jgi:DEAD/DEAH box helicase
MTPGIDWQQLSNLSGDALKGQVFSIMQRGAADLQTGDMDEPTLLGTVPRLADLLESRPELASFGEAVSTMARSVGLWNYIDPEVASARDELVAEIASVPQLGIVLHREQVGALNSLIEGRNLILSAPTSFGKSILIDALLLNERYRRVAIVLPTIALLDEFRRRLVHRFGTRFDVLMHHSEQPSKDRVIFLGTQERLINREDLGQLDLVVVDEFYKLDPARRDERSVTLNAAVYRLLGHANQFFFLGPNIDNVTVSSTSRWSFQFLRTRFSTVAVDTLDLKGIDDKEARLLSEVAREDNWPALVFVSSPDKANDMASLIAGRNASIGSGKELSEWMARNYGGRWELSEAVAAGIGVHHGRIPRALASRFVTLFNKSVLPILICTSTLIEGVNTAAKSVLIYDKTISNRNYDFFTFSNIKGRAGRLGQHYVGKVYLFHNPPGQENIGVNAPLFGELAEAPDELVVHIDEADATPSVSSRVRDVANRIGLSQTELRRFSAVGIETIAKLKDEIYEALAKRADLRWTTYPNYDQILALCSIVCAVKRPSEFGCRSAKQLAFYISRLRECRSMIEFFAWHSENYRGQPREHDNVFKFLRGCEFNLPEYFAVIELFLTKAGVRASYSLLLAELPRWFRDEALKILEEQGVPMQISERFFEAGDTAATLGERLRGLAIHRQGDMSAMEREWVLDALPD